MRELYTAHVQVTGGRDGRARANDGQLEIGLALPAPLGGSGQGSNPEQLFGAGFAACFCSSLQFVARQHKLPATPISVASEVTLTLAEDGAYGLRVRLLPSIPGLAEPERAALLAEAERICAYSNATRGLVALEIVSHA